MLSTASRLLGNGTSWTTSGLELSIRCCWCGYGGRRSISTEDSGAWSGTYRHFCVTSALTLVPWQRPQMKLSSWLQTVPAGLRPYGSIARRQEPTSRRRKRSSTPWPAGADPQHAATPAFFTVSARLIAQTPPSVPRIAANAVPPRSPTTNPPQAYDPPGRPGARSVEHTPPPPQSRPKPTGDQRHGHQRRAIERLSR